MDFDDPLGELQQPSSEETDGDSERQPTSHLQAQNGERKKNPKGQALLILGHVSISSNFGVIFWGLEFQLGHYMVLLCVCLISHSLSF